jgi:hypothetical protein
MWSYECVFEHPDKTKSIIKKGGMTNLPLTQTSITVVADTGELALQFAIKELEDNPGYELVGIARRNAIRTILKYNKLIPKKWKS